MLVHSFQMIKKCSFFRHEKQNFHLTSVATTFLLLNICLQDQVQPACQKILPEEN